jgi:ABC-type nitrate/sulfonate/bicarbonate transport system permease component
MAVTQLSSPDRTSTEAKVPVAQRNPRRYEQMLLGLIGLAAVFGGWQLCTSLGVVDATFSSSPVGLFGALVEFVKSGAIWAPLSSTLSTVAWGIGLSLVVGIPLGLVIGRSRVLFGLTEPLISIMYSVPYVVFLPIIIFWFGIDQQARIVIVIWAAIFPLLINVVAGSRNLDLSYLHVAQVFCASRLLTLRSVALPATSPYILAGVRQAVGRGLVGAIVAELFMGSAGMGYLVQKQTSNFQMDEAMAAIAVIAVVAIALTRAVAYFERRFTSWSTST